MASDYVNVPDRPVKFHEGWLEHKSQDNVWRRYWCVLRNNIIFIFNCQRTSQRDSHVGTIALGAESRFDTRDGDERTGYRFDLHTRRRINRFKTAKYSERELWRAFVEGIATGRVPDSPDLLPGQIEQVRSLLRLLYGGRQPAARSPHPVPDLRRRGSEPSVNPIKEGFDSPNTSTSGSFPVDDPENTDGYMEPTSPVGLPSASAQKRIFHSNPLRTDIPSWFFSSCTRDLAEKILSHCPGLGNTLMRENSNTSNLVISKRMDSQGGNQFSHFILKCFPEGYKIDVENPHEPMKSLSEVMDFFVTTSGASTTQPMGCNDLKLLGLDDLIYNNYNKQIVRFNHDADSGEETLDTNQTSRNWSPVARDVGYSQTARAATGRTTVSVRGLFDTGGPLEPAPPPPCAVLQKTGKNVMPSNATGPQGRWTNTRSKSVSSISPEDLKRVQATRLAQLSATAHGPPSSHILRSGHYVNDPRHSNTQNRNSNHSPPPIPPNHPSPSPVPALPSPSTSHPPAPPAPPLPSTTGPSAPVAPPLPPNHPPPLTKAKSEVGLSKQGSSGAAAAVNSDSKTTVKRTVPKHSQSVGAADAVNRKASPRHTQSTGATDELAMVAARILNKKKEAPPVAVKPTASAPKQDTADGGETVPKGPTESFKQKLECLLSPTSPPGQGPAFRIPVQQPAAQRLPEKTNQDCPPKETDQETVYESIDHYQNVGEIRKSPRGK